MIDARQLLADLQSRQKKLARDLRQQIDERPELADRQQSAYQAARKAGRTAETLNAWLDGEVTQAAVAWLLACTFVRFCEDNGLIAAPALSGPGDALRRARDAAREYFRAHPTEHERHYLEHVFDRLARLPALAGLLDRAHNPLFTLPPSYEAARDLLAFWQEVDPATGELRHDFIDPDLDTRFLGDLYQDLSEAARKRYALLQTPVFIEEFILDRTLEPAIQTFGLEGLRLIDPTCGSGHFLLGAFDRLLARWQRQAPALDVREHVIHVLSAIHGVDINPFATAIARFRLLVAALKACRIRTLKEAPGWQFNLTTGDSLLHGPRFGEGDLPLSETGIAAEYRHVYAAEDREELHRILGQRYHAVVGNPPYITASDTALNALYRERYPQTCYMKFSLGVPFTERFFQLAQPGGDAPAGFVGMITTNSFMKREFGKKLIEAFFPTHDLTHVIDTSGAYIPGHGTPTVILFGRNQPPIAPTVRAVLGIRGEPVTPEDPAQGRVWASIVRLADHPGQGNDYVSVADLERERLATHPWSLQGGAAPAVLEAIESSAARPLSAWTTGIGVSALTGEDDAYVVSRPLWQRVFPRMKRTPFVEGEQIRDYEIRSELIALFPHDLQTLDEVPGFMRHIWKFGALLRTNIFFAKTKEQRGLRWWDFTYWSPEKLAGSSITFAEVATHNHFVLDRGGKVFKQTAPVIKLPAGASEDEHLGLLGLLNSSTACFWLRQNCFGKGGDHVGTDGARVVKNAWEERFAFNATRLEQFPLPDQRPLELVRHLDALARERAIHLPATLATQFPLTRAELDDHRAKAAVLLGKMIALQEELDWWCYRAYGLLDEDLTFDGEPPAIQLGQRAFEIVLARRIKAGEVQTTWFSRHGSTPITHLPADWPAGYRALVERRIAHIGSSAWLALLERPEYKRRWNQPGWQELEHAALRGWLLDRLETAAYWPEPALQRATDLAARAERDADFMAVAALYTGQPGFDVAALVGELVADEAVPALAVLRYKPAGLRKRADWEHTWAAQRREDTIDAAVAAEHPRQDGESHADWQARIAPLQSQRKLAEVGRLPAPPKYASADFLSGTYWRLRGGLDVPKERFFSVPDPLAPGAWLYGWAGWNPARRAQALASAWIEGEERTGAEPTQMLPLLVALVEQLPWVKQWHNAIDPETDVRPGDYFEQWLGEQLNRQGWTPETLAEWQPTAAPRRRRRRSRGAG